MNITIHHYLLLFCFSSLIITAGCNSNEASSKQQRPNIILITSMNHPVTACDPYDGLFAKLSITPHLKQFAEANTLFTNCFTPSAIARPAGAVMHSGQYPHRTKTYDLYSDFPVKNQHMAKELNRLGYETVIYGHWHFEEQPVHFDDYKVTPIHHSFYRPPYREKGKGNWPNNVVTYSNYVDETTTGFATAYFEKQKSRKKSFFLQINLKASQEIDSVRPQFQSHFTSEMIPEPTSLLERDQWGSIANKGVNDSLNQVIGSSYSRRHNYRSLVRDLYLPDSLSEDEATRLAYQLYVKKYMRAYRSIDQQFNKLIRSLKETGLYENSIIIYTSHNGLMFGAHDLMDKRWMYEEAMHIPLIIHHPYGQNKHPKIAHLISLVDLAPTIIEMAGGEAPEYMDGKSFSSAFHKSGMKNPRTSVYYQYWMHLVHHDIPAHYGIRTLNSKLIFFNGEHYNKALYGTKSMSWADQSNLITPTPMAWEFYDLSSDPDEKKNAYTETQYQDEIARLKDQLALTRKRLGLQKSSDLHISTVNTVE